MEDDAPLRGRRVLIVEDDYLVALVVADFLADAGAEILGPIGSVPDAVEFVRRTADIDGAVLDVNLHGQKSYEIADVLSEQGVGFVFATGYGSNEVDADYKMRPRCEKPFTRDNLLAALLPVLKLHATS